MVNVAINGYGTIGKRVADAVSRQDDMSVMGVTKTRPSYEAKMAVDKGYDLYAASDTAPFEAEDIPVQGTLEDLLAESDIVVDCTPGGIGASYKPAYEEAGVKAIWQGGEDHELAGISFNSIANYEDALGEDYARVVSCNTTGLTRLIYPLDQEYGVRKVRATMMRRGADPRDIKRGPINAIVCDPVTLPSHHGPDVNSVMPNVDIVTTAVKLPTTLMHLHGINMELEEDVSVDDVRETIRNSRRIMFVRAADGIKSTAQVMEYARDLGRPWNDLYENIIWEESINIDRGELYLFQAIHQESDVVPENIDCIRALTRLEEDPVASIEKTNQAMGINH